MIVVFDVGGHAANFAFDGGVGDREFPSGAKLSFLSGGSIFEHVFPSLIQQCISQATHPSMQTPSCVYLYGSRVVYSKRGGYQILLTGFHGFYINTYSF